MHKKESSLIKEILVVFSRKYGRLFRQNVGQAWTGEINRYSSRQSVTVFPGDVVIRRARPFKAGLCKGSSDTIGFTNIKIDSSHIGKVFPVFTAIEVKTGKQKASKEQKDFIDFVNAFNG